MHPVFAYYLWLSAMMRIMTGETIGPGENAAAFEAAGARPEGFAKGCAPGLGCGAAIPALGQFMRTDVTSERLPDRFLDLLSELHWAKAA